MNVSLEARGGGLSFGKSKIANGVGEFSGVKDIGELLDKLGQGRLLFAAK